MVKRLPLVIIIFHEKMNVNALKVTHMKYVVSKSDEFTNSLLSELYWALRLAQILDF